MAINITSKDKNIQIKYTMDGAVAVYFKYSWAASGDWDTVPHYGATVNEIVPNYNTQYSIQIVRYTLDGQKIEGETATVTCTAYIPPQPPLYTGFVEPVTNVELMDYIGRKPKLRFMKSLCSEHTTTWIDWGNGKGYVQKTSYYHSADIVHPELNGTSIFEYDEKTLGALEYGKTYTYKIKATAGASTSTEVTGNYVIKSEYCNPPEIIGLQTDGLTVKPNRINNTVVLTFTPDIQSDYTEIDIEDFEFDEKRPYLTDGSYEDDYGTWDGRTFTKKPTTENPQPKAGFSIDKNLEYGKTYKFRLRSVSAGGHFAFTPEYNFSIPPLPVGEIGLPHNIKVSTKGNNIITYFEKYRVGMEYAQESTILELFIYENIGSSSTKKPFTILKGTPPVATPYKIETTSEKPYVTFENLSYGKKYCVKVTSKKVDSTLSMPSYTDIFIQPEYCGKPSIVMNDEEKNGVINAGIPKVKFDGTTAIIYFSPDKDSVKTEIDIHGFNYPELQYETRENGNKVPIYHYITEINKEGKEIITVVPYSETDANGKSWDGRVKTIITSDGILENEITQFRMKGLKYATNYSYTMRSVSAGNKYAEIQGSFKMPMAIPAKAVTNVNVDMQGNREVVITFTKEPKHEAFDCGTKYYLIKEWKGQTIEGDLANKNYRFTYHCSHVSENDNINLENFNSIGTFRMNESTGGDFTYLNTELVDGGEIFDYGVEYPFKILTVAKDGSKAVYEGSFKTPVEIIPTAPIITSAETYLNKMDIRYDGTTREHTEINVPWLNNGNDNWINPSRFNSYFLNNIPWGYVGETQLRNVGNGVDRSTMKHKYAYSEKIPVNIVADPNPTAPSGINVDVFRDTATFTFTKGIGCRKTWVDIYKQTNPPVLAISKSGGDNFIVVSVDDSTTDAFVWQCNYYAILTTETPSGKKASSSKIPFRIGAQNEGLSTNERESKLSRHEQVWSYMWDTNNTPVIADQYLNDIFIKNNVIYRNFKTSDAQKEYGSKVIFLTFNCMCKKDKNGVLDATYPNYTLQILDVLKGKKVRATFFVTENYIKQYPTHIQRMIADGHIVGNLTKNYSSLANVSNPQVSNPKDSKIGRQNFEKQLNDCAKAYKDLMKADMPKIVRPPMYYFSELSLYYAMVMGYRTILESLHIKDSTPNTELDIPLSALSKRLFDGCIIAFNTCNSNLLAQLPNFITTTKNDYFFNIVTQTF